jgi:hypothetical protein
MALFQVCKATRRDKKDDARLSYVFSHLPQVPTIDAMSQKPTDSKPQRPKDRGGAISELNVAIDALHLAEQTSRITPIKAVFASVDTLLTTIRVCPLLSYNDYAPGSRIARTRRMMNWVVPSSGYLVPISAERLTGGQTERKRTSSVSPCMMRWIS